MVWKRPKTSLRNIEWPLTELSSKPDFFKLAAEACRPEVVVKSNFFVRFLEELRRPKSPSEIN